MSGNIQSGGVFMEQQSSQELLLVEAYGDGGFRFQGKRFEGSVIVFGNSFFPVAAKTVEDLSEADFAPLLTAKDKPEVLFIGTGKTISLLPAETRKYLETIGYSAELMDTGATARTYNVLQMESRRVAALLVQVE